LSSLERTRVSRVLFAFRISTAPSTLSQLTVSRSKKEKNKERGELKKNVEWVLKQQKTKKNNIHLRSRCNKDWFTSKDAAILSAPSSSI
jgi:hypothetical protein